MTACDWKACTNSENLMLNMTTDAEGKGRLTLLCPDHQDVYGLLYNAALRSVHEKHGIGSKPRPESDVPEVLVRNARATAERLGVRV